MKKTLSLILSLVMLLSVTAGINFSAFALDSGKCGDNVNYTFNAATGRLVITGTGKMYDYEVFGDSPFENNKDIKIVDVSSGVTSIGDRAFPGCTGIETLALSEATSLTEIGELAFANCKSLNKIVWSSSNKIASIGGYAFESCSALKEFAVPSGVKSIAAACFIDCSALRCITIPSGVTQIANQAFDYCNSLTDVFFTGTETQWNGIAISEGHNTLLLNAELHLKSWGGMLGDNVIYCSETDDNGNIITTVSGTGATYNYAEVDNISPLYSESMKTLVVNEGVTTLGTFIFRRCYRLNTVTLPSTLTRIGSSAFYDAAIAGGVYYNGTKAGLTAITYNSDGYNDVLLNAPLYGGKCGSNVNYYFNPSTKTMTISGEGAMTDFATQAAVPWYGYMNKIQNLVIEPGVTTIGSNAFLAAPITELTTPATITKIGEDAFSYCNSLKSITINGYFCEIDEMAFREIDAVLDSITLNGVKTVGESAFYETDSKELNLVYVEKIDSSAFELNETVEEVTIPYSCTYVGYAAFSSCDNLKKVIFENPNTEIAYGAFGSCKPVICGLKGSTAEAYAENNGMEYEKYVCKNHTPSEPVKEKEIPATYTAAGSYESVIYCSVCGEEVSRTPVTVPQLEKNANTLYAKGKTVKVKKGTVKKKSVKIKRAKAITVKNAVGALSFKKAKGNKKIMVAKNGKITVKKGLKKGTYKIKIKVTAAGSDEYKAAVKTVTVIIRVK
ncbi:MAG: leucine-rich repeat domain-containing protein [Eubacterium sp.]|nr:leucine-rich repeat domain-containing protein [Eubacterium sp.]